jgi:NAD(P)-dependent dehydrogenase (short-subunit alcohol dehydrogenase family)
MSAAARTAIVTGGGYGIGRAAAARLARDGWSVVLVDRDAGRLAETRDLIESAGGRARAVAGDVTQAETMRAAVKAGESLAPIKALATCAAMRHAGPITAISEAQWKETLDVVLNGVFLACHAVIPRMIATGGGAIVNVSSPDGYGRRNMVAYAAAKGAVNTLSLCLASDHLADRVRVNVVLPPATITGMTEQYSAARLDEMAARAVAGRMAGPEDVARLICFLLSDEGETFTGGVFGPQLLAGR